MGEEGEERRTGDEKMRDGRTRKTSLVHLPVAKGDGRLSGAATGVLEASAPPALKVLSVAGFKHAVRRQLIVHLSSGEHSPHLHVRDPNLPGN